MTPQEILRQVSIAHKLGEMADAYDFGEDEEEKWLNWGVEKLLKVVKEQESALGPNSVSGEDAQGVKLVLADLDLPAWVNNTSLGAPLEALGAFYARKGNVE